MAVRHFALPDLGEGLEEAEILEWHVAPGDRVVADQPLVSVETDKAVVEVPAPWAGTVAELLAEPGEPVAVGAVIARFETGAREDAGAIVGALETNGRRPPPAPSADGAGGAPVPPSGEPGEARAAGPGGPVRAMPAARALARAEGADLAAVRATGQGGVVQRADVARHLEGRAPRPGWERLSGPRRAMARRMAQGGGVVPATVQDVADVTPWISPEADVLVRLVRACAAGARAAPALNAWYDPERIERRLHDGLDLGIAVDWEEGLSVPVIRGAESLGAAALRAEADRLIAAVRDRRLAPEAARGATLTLSNFGPLGGRHGALVVSPPEVAILGAGRAFEHVVWGANGPGRGVALPLSLSFDHRAATGGDAARFLAAAIADLERPD